jgi:DNA-binding NtrC family response regulator
MKEPAESASILVVDDVPANIGFLVETLAAAGYDVRVARDGDAALEQSRYMPPCLILLDVMMPGIDGFETCRRLKRDPALRDIPVIFMTALSDAEDKVKAFAVGASDFVSKPFQHEEVLARVRTHISRRRLERQLAQANADLESRVEARTRELSQALAEVERLKSRLALENRYLKQEISEHANPGEIIGSSPALAEVLRKVDLVARTDSTVLIHGETGTGKELIARAIHERSSRADGPLVKLNCSAISAGLVESELFGHVRGAFTGASDRRVGRFELADGGTLFLDEVSELPLETQAKLLRVLQEREFEPVGSSKSVRVDVRIVAATNRDLARDVANGRFRSDLLYRLNVFPIELPPLRERRGDIVELAQHFMVRMARKLGKTISSIQPSTLDRLLTYDWPGNIRDLQNAIERAAILSPGPQLVIDWVLAAQTPITRSSAPQVSAEPGPAVAAGGPTPDVCTLQALERQHVISALRRTGGRIEGPQGAARLLGLKPSTTRFRIRKLGIRREDYASS